MLKDKDLEGLFMSIRNRLSISIAKIVPPNEIEDIVQETYVRVCQIEDKQTINYPRTFIFRTARNLAIDHLKSAESRLTDYVHDDFDLDLPAVERWADEPFQRAVSNNDFALFCQAVRQLPRQCRKTFVLKKVYGFSQKEIASRLDLSQSTVEKHISTGIKRCAQFMSLHTDYGAPKGNALGSSASVKKNSETSRSQDRGKG